MFELSFDTLEQYFVFSWLESCNEMLRSLIFSLSKHYHYYRDQLFTLLKCIQNPIIYGVPTFNFALYLYLFAVVLFKDICISMYLTRSCDATAQTNPKHLLNLFRYAIYNPNDDCISYAHLKKYPICSPQLVASLPINLN